MFTDPSFYDEVYLDEDNSEEFEKFTRRNKISKRKKDNIQQKRREKAKQKEQLIEESENNIIIL